MVNDVYSQRNLVYNSFAIQENISSFHSSKVVENSCVLDNQEPLRMRSLYVLSLSPKVSLLSLSI